MSSMSIGEVARRAQLRTSAIRYYEEAGLLPSPARVGGRRRYDPSVLERLAIIRLAQRAGFSISELRALMHEGEAGGIVQARPMVESKLADIEARIREAEQMRALLRRWLSCTCVAVSSCDLIAESERPPKRRLAVM